MRSQQLVANDDCCNTAMRTQHRQTWGGCAADLGPFAEHGGQGRHLEDVAVGVDHQVLAGGGHKVVDPLGALHRLQVCKLEVGAEAAGVLGQAVRPGVPLGAHHHTAPHALLLVTRQL